MVKKILVTGASGDIGGAIVQHIVSLGHRVIGLDKVMPKNDTNFEHFFKVDLRKDYEISKLSQKIKNNLTPLWAVVHCAGVYPIVNFAEYNIELWDEVHSVNLRSIFLITQLLKDFIVEGGRIVIVSSGAAHIGSRDIGYSSSKAGTIGITRSLGKAFANRGILVNSVCPGVIKTQMSTKMSSQDKEAYIKKIPLRRFGLPEEISICISFLLDEKNSYMTGASIDVNGGLYMR